MDILGTSPFSEKQVDAFLKHKNCPQYARHYRIYGEKYGVRWDYAVAQSCLETGFWKFGGDVKREQNNFAGLGATGGGEPGASFFNAEVGILAQIQHLAIYAGVDIPKEKLTYERTKKLIDWGIKGSVSTFEGLSGRWAADKKYGQSISIIYAEMRDFISTLPKEDGEDNVKNTDGSVTWLEFNRTDNGKPAVTAYAGSEPKYTRYFKNWEDLDSFKAFFPNAHGVLVAETDKKIIPRKPDFGEEDKPQKPTKKRKVLLDPGHSESRVGARGGNGVQEENLNRLAAEVVKEKLIAAGHDAVIYDPANDNLTDIGSRARGYDLFISIHHNAFDADGVDEYTCVMTHASKRRTADNLFASLAAKKIVSSIGDARLFQKAGELPGVYPAGLSVLSAAINTGCPCAVLVELYFCDDYSSVSVAEARTKRGAIGLADAAIEWLAR